VWLASHLPLKLGGQIAAHSSGLCWLHHALEQAISGVVNPNMVRNEKDFEIIIIAQRQKQNVAWVAFALIPKLGALLFDKWKLRRTTAQRIDCDRHVEIFDARSPVSPPEGELLT
jgi:hypothetical protein